MGEDRTINETVCKTAEECGRLYTFNDEMRAVFGGKVYRLSLSASVSCPNRDGTCGTGGCIFCSAGGSGDFAESAQNSIHEQIQAAKHRVSAKLGKHPAGYMAYFQSFTGTYGDEEHIEKCFRQAASEPEIKALSVATRPDCISDRMLGVLSDINRTMPVYVELGLQTIHEDTAEYINRGYRLPVFEEAFRRLKARGLRVVVHVIVGLPGENADRTKATVRYLSSLEAKTGGIVDGIKLQLLQVLKGTALAERLPEDIEAAEKRGNTEGSIILNDGKTLPCYNITSYSELIADLVSMLPPETAVHRMTGDAPKKLLLFPLLPADKKRVLNSITHTMRSRGML